MAIASAVGLLLLMGYGMTSVAYSMPFIVFCKYRQSVLTLLYHPVYHFPSPSWLCRSRSRCMTNHKYKYYHLRGVKDEAGGDNCIQNWNCAGKLEFSNLLSNFLNSFIDIL